MGGKCPSTPKTVGGGEMSGGKLSGYRQGCIFCVSYKRFTYVRIVRFPIGTAPIYSFKEI